MSVDLIIAAMMGTLLYTSRRSNSILCLPPLATDKLRIGTGGSLNVMKKMTLLIGSGGLLTFTGAVALIVLTQTTSPESHWIAIFTPLPGSLASISLLSLLFVPFMSALYRI